MFLRSIALAPDADDEDATDLALVAEGDRPALARLYDRQAGLLLALAVRVAGDRELAEELVQEVFLELWHHPPPLSGAGSVRAWMIGRMRRLALARRSGDSDSAEPIAGLPPELAQVVSLAMFDGLSCAEIARRLRLSAAAVRARMARGLEMLRRRRS
jgi:RNA polymerase sigma-70 factor, ECF subfamily